MENMIETDLKPNSNGVIKSIQRGHTATAGTITISEVNMAKSFVTSSNKSSFAVAANDNNSGSHAYSTQGAVYLSSSTTLEFSGGSTVYWEVIEYV